ncbi:hypothetical protein EAI_11116 [Harpegnathos saltator]|uniref:Uncharacterized protein n=1 Tax=Harpegnathos saltator TaxID=610380 RepID=E2BRR7_HARSA|nr:hypothetical protein EAI_11116 [Harpegnathos saltator]
MLRGIREAPLHVAVSSPPSKHSGNAGQSVKEAPHRVPSAPSPLIRVEREWAITPPMVDMMEEEEAPIGIIEVQKGLIPGERRRPVRERNEARVAKTGPKIRENILLDNKVRVERREDSEKNAGKGLEGDITKMVFKALNDWTTQGREIPKKGAGKDNKIKGVGSRGVVQRGRNKYDQEYPQLPPTQSQRKEQQNPIDEGEMEVEEKRGEKRARAMESEDTDGEQPGEKVVVITEHDGH